MPAKNWFCIAHPRSATACRACLSIHLQEFRTANLRTGIKAATTRIEALRARYAARRSASVNALTVAVELGKLLHDLAGAADRLADTPIDPSTAQLPSVSSRN